MLKFISHVAASSSLLVAPPPPSASFRLLLPPPPSSSAASSSPGSGSVGPWRASTLYLRSTACVRASRASLMCSPGSRRPARTSTVYDFRTPVGLAGLQLYTVSGLPWACRGLNDKQFPSISGLPWGVPGLNYKYVEISRTCPKKYPTRFQEHFEETYKFPTCLNYL